MPKTKVEVYDKDQLIYPFIESDHVTFSNGMKVSEMLDQSISMPTVTHEDLSFKAGVGDQDVSSAIVDSSVAEMTIKGKTYQNILPEPSTHVLTNNKEMFKVNEGLDPNVEIVDGVSKSAILKGQTLVNLVTYDKTNLSTSIWNHFVHFSDLKYNLKSSTKYLLIFNITNCNVDSIFSIQLDDKSQYTYFKGKSIDINGNGVYKAIRETKDDLSNVSHVLFTTHNPETTSGTYDMKIMIIEYQDGMENWDIPYFEGMQSVKMPVLTTTGKNLIPLKEDWVQGQIMNGGGISVNSYALRTKSKIKVKPNTKYTFSTKSSDCKIAYHEWEANGKYIKDSGWITAFPYTFTTNNKTEYINLTTRRVSNVDSTVDNLDDTLIWQLEESSTATSYEPHKSNILSTPEEVVLRSLPNGVKDTLNLNTGEYVQRIGEVVLDGSEAWNKDTTTGGTKDNTSIFHTEANFNGFKPSPNVEYRDTMMLCDKIPVKGRIYNLDEEGLMINGDGRIYIRINLSRLETNNADGFKSFLAKENIKIQCELATPVVKTVDLSSSGNWEKIVLDGSEDEVWHNGDSSWANKIFRLDGVRHTPNIMNSTNALVETGLLFSSHFEEKGMNHLCNVKPQPEGVSIYGDSIFVGSPQISTIGELRTWLSQNPITVWYQTKTHQDSTQIKQPIFFKDGHIIQSSGADHLLIPTLDYQAKTSNSYVMDLMKTNTRYTMKAKSASGTFTIDGTSYGAGTNGTFTTPSSMTNKFLVMSNNANEEVMILEGDVTSKTIPYFKGIKSAFEGEDKIEVLSTDSNLLINNQRLQEEGVLYFTKGWNAVRLTIKAKKVKIVVKNKTGVTGTKLSVKDDVENESNFMQLFEIDEVFTTIEMEYSLKNSNVISFCSYGSLTFNNETFFDNYDIEVYTLDNMDETLIVEKSNSTKIPLLSPLRSLPNGVCDEIILDRENNKAKIIQRVGKTMITTPQVSKWYMDNNGVANVSRIRLEIDSLGARKSQKQLINNLVPVTGRGFSFDEETTYMDDTQNYWLWLHVSNNRLPAPTIEGFKSWLSQNPLVIYYELETPIITEVDLEGFPYIYKDGHIFLNGEIVPTTEIIYSINQCQQISASNEDIIRHEKELTYLQKLIAQYVQVDYESALLSLKV